MDFIICLTCLIILGLILGVFILGVAIFLIALIVTIIKSAIINRRYKK